MLTTLKMATVAVVLIVSASTALAQRPPTASPAKGAGTNALAVKGSFRTKSGGPIGDLQIAPVQNGFEGWQSRDLNAPPARKPDSVRRAVDRPIEQALAVNERIRAEKGRQEAIRHLDELIQSQSYGAQPELTLRRGILLIEENRLADAAASVGHPSRPLRSPDLFFDEINHRLANQNLAENVRKNLRGYAEYVDFQDFVLQRSLGDIVLPFLAGGTFGSRIQLGKVPDLTKAATIDPAKLRTGQAVIYRQDSPGLNNLDWTISPDHSLQQVIEGRLGKIVPLLRGDIAHFRPSAIYSDGTVTLLKVHQHVESLAAMQSYRARNPATDLCSDKSSDQRQCPDVYLVVAN